MGREQQLTQLRHAFDGAIAGRGGVRFVVGDAGSGKTALVREFARLAEQRHDDLIVASGLSDAQTGIGDPYLPFRELLAQLTGDVDAKLAQGGISEESANRLKRFLGVSGDAILDLGPDLIGTIIPGAGLVTRAATYVARKSGRLKKLEELADRKDEPTAAATRGIDQTNIFEQYTNVITHLAERQPLLLVLDDLQWADAASMGLLFHLGRNLGEARVLLVGTYRPAEVALGRNGERHPLEKVLAEFKRYFGDLTLDLGAATDDERRLLVDEILDSEPHRLTNAFREAIYRHTYGHPLFTVELLRALRERGDLVADRDGMWVEAPSLSWGELPARVEGVIEERIGRLDGELHDTLTVASVEGEEFTAEVVAAVDGAEARHVVRRLGRELENRHRLVRSGGLRRLGNCVRLSLFSFQHNLFQRYLYDELNESERAYLHEDVGTALEQLCGADTDVYAVQLARHFVVAGDSARASIYLRRAGQLALARYAYEEAVTHLTTALELTASSDFEARWDLVAAREEAFGSLGRRDPQWADLELLRQLAQESQGRWRLVDAELRVAHFCRSTGDFSAAIAAAERALEVLGNKRDVAREATAYIEWGAALVDLARNEEARQKLERALGLADSAGLHGAQARSLNLLGTIHQERGDLDAARHHYQEVLRISQRIHNLRREAIATNGLGVVAARKGRLEEAQRHFVEVAELLHRIGDRPRAGIALHNIGEVASERHRLWSARDSYLRALAVAESTANRPGECLSRNALAKVSIRLGLLGEAAEHLDQSRRLARETGHAVHTSDALGVGALLASRKGDWVIARVDAERALQIAVDIGEPWLRSQALDVLGGAFEVGSEFQRAEAAYDEAAAVRREHGSVNAAVESVGGLARVALATGNHETAMRHVEDILAHLETGTLEGTIDPVGVYLSCHDVLAAAEDPRADEVLDQARAFLHDLVESIPDGEMRRAFYENVPSHAAITRR